MMVQAEMNNNYFYVYILSNPEKTILDTGVTGDLNVRLEKLEHTFYFSPEPIPQEALCRCLLYWECYTDAKQAVTRGETVRKLSFKRKKVLIDKVNPKWGFFNDKVYRSIGSMADAILL